MNIITLKNNIKTHGILKIRVGKYTFANIRGLIEREQTFCECLDNRFVHGDGLDAEMLVGRRGRCVKHWSFRCIFQHKKIKKNCQILQILLKS